MNTAGEKRLPALPLGSKEDLDLDQQMSNTTFLRSISNYNIKPQTLAASETSSRPKLPNSLTDPTHEGISARRACPNLTLNLHSTTTTSFGNNNNNNTNINYPMTSPAQFSASSTEDCNYYFLNEDISDSSSTPLNNSVNELSTHEKMKPPMLSLNNAKNFKKNIIINQQTPTNLMSTRQINNNINNINESSKKIEIKSLNRRNFKQLSLEPIITLSDLNTPINNNSTNDITSNSSISHIDIKDPERRIDANELIENIKNLELGLEYQMPINADELVALKKLGSGQSGTVSKVLHLPTQKTMARKIVHLEAKEVVQSQIMRELRIMHECDSPFIIEFYGTFLNEGNVVICMEYADCGSLAHVFKLTGPFPEFMLKHVAYSVLSGLIYLYDQHRIIHRDVKPSNVLLTSKGKIKLCDFGVSRELINSMADTFVGTSTYMSPERIQGGVYSVKGDVWSLGIMLYELASGKLAFSNDNNSGPVSILELLQRIVNEQPPSLPVKDGFSEELSSFVSLCLRKESQRPSPSEMMNHPFLSDFLDDDGIRISPKYRGNIRKWSKNVRRVQKGKPMKE